MTKLELQSIIEKYHLNGLVEGVKWEINKDKQLKINFMSPSREMIGSIIYNDIPLPESTIGISDTTQLDKLLSITNGELMLDYVKEKKTVTKLLISDNQFNLNYALADIVTISKPGEYNGPEEYDVAANLSGEIIGALIKAKNALTTSENVVVEQNLNGLGFTFGGDVEYANKVTYTVQHLDEYTGDGIKLVYSSTLLKEIMACNKDMSDGRLYINRNGLMKLIFNYKNMQSTYYIVAKES
jgi:hypothetical protein